jgi:lipoprotein-anchoring transpeptidase ErfK/SrfK
VPHAAAQRDACARTTGRKVVRVSIAAQRAWFCAGHVTVRSVPVTTGALARPGRATPTGGFRVEGHARNATLRPDGGGSYHVRYWVPFSGTDYGFHDASWQQFPLGSPKYRWRGSHGCVHVSLSGMRFLYRWATTGTRVQITR